jgi:hypothetical protein
VASSKISGTRFRAGLHPATGWLGTARLAAPATQVLDGLAKLRDGTALAPTFFCMLASKFRDGIPDLAPDGRVGLVCEAVEELRPDCIPLELVEGQEEVCRLARRRLSGFRGLTPKDDGGECPGL